MINLSIPSFSKDSLELNKFEFFSNLPDELTLYIFSFCQPKELLSNISLVCKKWKLLMPEAQTWVDFVRKNLTTQEKNRFQCYRLATNYLSCPYHLHHKQYLDRTLTFDSQPIYLGLMIVQSHFLYLSTQTLPSIVIKLNTDTMELIREFISAESAPIHYIREYESFLLAIHDGSIITAWDKETGELIHSYPKSLPIKDSIINLALHFRYLIALTEKGVYLLDPETCQEAYFLPQEKIQNFEEMSLLQIQGEFCFIYGKTSGVLKCQLLNLKNLTLQSLPCSFEQFMVTRNGLGHYFISQLNNQVKVHSFDPIKGVSIATDFLEFIDPDFDWLICCEQKKTILLCKNNGYVKLMNFSKKRAFIVAPALPQNLSPTQCSITNIQAFYDYIFITYYTNSQTYGLSIFQIVDDSLELIMTFKEFCSEPILYEGKLIGIPAAKDKETQNQAQSFNSIRVIDFTKKSTDIKAAFERL